LDHAAELIHVTAGELIPIISIVLGIGMIVVAILTKHRRDMQQLELHHRERMAAIEKGLELPPERPTPAAAVRSNGYRGGGSRYLLRGLVWTGVGLALTLSQNEWTDHWHSYGWIAVAVGVAYLIYYAVEGRRMDYPPPPDRGPPGGSAP
jgi:hypothetical protein